MATRAVLFDFDGVLADTENVHVAAWQRTFKVMGWAEPEESCLRASEVDDRTFALGVFARRKVEGADVDGWTLRKRELARQMILDRPRAVPGALAVVDRLRAGGIRLGVVTSAPRGIVEGFLGAFDLLGAFEVIVAAEDAEHPKPDPAPYRLAVDWLGLPAAEVVAIEDSPTGLASAQGAGIRAVAVGKAGASDGEDGGLVDLRDLPAILAKLGIGIGIGAEGDTPGA